MTNDSEYGSGNENFSTGTLKDTWWSDLFRMDSYVVTPGRALKKYYYKTKSVSIIARNIPRDPKSPVHY